MEKSVGVTVDAPIFEARTRAIVLAGGSRSDAHRQAVAFGVNPMAILDRRQAAVSPYKLRSLARAHGAQCAVIHTKNWRRQVMPQVYTVALAALPVKQRLLIDDSVGAMRVVRRRELMREAVRAPVDVVQGLSRPVCEAARFVVVSRSSRARPLGSKSGVVGHLGVLCIWLGPAGASVGGSVTHVSGILKSFRKAGLRVGLITSEEPPAQLADGCHDIEVLPPESAGTRLVSFAAPLVANRAIRCVGTEVAARVGATFVYQRHSAFLVAGAELAEGLHIPLALEWNASEVWTRANWRTPIPGERLFNPLMQRMERNVVTRAAVIAAPSIHAARMAVDAGASPDTVRVVPNGVDLEEVGRCVAASDGQPWRERPVIGWVGSFGPWHGAEILIRALARLPAEVGALMIGDGPERLACQELASKLGLESRIEWTGLVPHAVALQRLSACDVLASPHVPLPAGQPFFGSPTKLFEYMAIGRPIVASRLEQLGEILEDGRTAILVAPGDPVSLSSAIAEVLDMPDRGAFLGDAAQREARARHTWDARGRLILDALAS